MRGIKLETVAPIVARFLGMEAEDLPKHFSPADESHLPQILAMRKAHVSTASSRDEAYLRWRYSFSECEQGQELNENRMWVFTAGASVLGCVGVESINLKMDGDNVQAAKVMDLAVMPEVDGKGLGVWMNLSLQQMGRPVIALGSNKNSLGIVSKIFHRLPNQKVYKNILNSRYYFSGRSSRGLLTSSASIFYDAGLSCLLLVKSLGLSGVPTLEGIKRFDRSHAEALAAMNHFGIQLRRDCDYLNWRLFDNPRDPVEVTGIWAEGSLVGYYALSLRSPLRSADLVQAFILDWGLLPGRKYEKLLTSSLWKCQLLLKRQGVESISAFGYDARSDRILRSAGLHHREDDTKTVSIFAKNPEDLLKMQRAEQWFLTGADTDYA